MSHHNDHLLYPNLENCTIVTTSGTAPAAASSNGTTAALAEPISLPSNCMEAVNTPLPKLYEFTVEHEVMKKKKERTPQTQVNVEQDQSIETTYSTSKGW
mmetsp:Transcript_8293/g.11412  ORF Transcript_8293/g.11412 Transcript_8293/m.11412 type:complete len:100 (-) Transcript_8293:307-606(-)